MNSDIFSEFSSASLPILVLIATGYLARRLLVQDSKAWGRHWTR
jgi:predicted permease